LPYDPVVPGYALSNLRRPVPLKSKGKKIKKPEINCCDRKKNVFLEVSYF
jgi:hypothetical protein